MTKKDFEFIASILRVIAVDVGLSRFPLVCKRFASELEATNPRFDRARFLKACGVA